MCKQKYSLTWLGMLPDPVPENLKTAQEVAAFEAKAFFSGRKEKVQLQLQPDLKEAYEIHQDGNDLRIIGGDPGILYGTYALIRHLYAGSSLPAGLQKPFYSLRMLNSWDNMDGSVERGYAGRSLWFEANRFDYDPSRIRQLGRMLASVGINSLCLNNVNVHFPAQELTGSLLPGLRDLAALLRPFGIHLLISVDFSLPLSAGLATADPLDEQVRRFWKEKADQIYESIPDLHGFLVKADSEHRPGPNTYGRSHAEGANMLAEALQPHRGVLVWRCFVYNCMQDWRDTHTDRPCAAYDLYMPLDGRFADNVILQIKNGPYDFQVREPVSPLLYGLTRTRKALEVQLAQEYTGQQIDLYAMPPLFREVMDQMGPGQVQAIAAVSNLGRDFNWTGHPFASLNLFAFGQFAWSPDADPGEVIKSWIACTYTLPGPEAEKLCLLLLHSREVYEKYTATLGLCWMITPHTHYGPNPYGYEFDNWGTYIRADREAVGIDRTEKGTGYVSQYPEPWRSLYANPDACPENLLLFFHRVHYTDLLPCGKTLIQKIYDDHFEGAREAEEMQACLTALSLPEPDRKTVLERMSRQVSNAREWRDVVNTFFYRFSGIPDDRGRIIYP